MPTTLEKTRRLVRAATGEEYGDGYIVTNVVVGYAEPGYGDDESVIVFGNWNPKRFPMNDDPPLTKNESLPVRLAIALDRVGAECQWLDEWATCEVCHRAMRIEADSYSWQMYGAFVEDAAGYVCADCMKQHLDSYLEDYINEPTRCVTWLSATELAAAGWTQWEPDDPHTYENGWYLGQTDDPKKVTEEIRRFHPEDDVSILFLLNGVGQFDINFSAWTKEVQ